MSTYTWAELGSTWEDFGSSQWYYINESATETVDVDLTAVVASKHATGSSEPLSVGVAVSAAGSKALSVNASPVAVEATPEVLGVKHVSGECSAYTEASLDSSSLKTHYATLQLDIEITVSAFGYKALFTDLDTAEVPIQVVADTYKTASSSSEETVVLDVSTSGIRESSGVLDDYVSVETVDYQGTKSTIDNAEPVSTEVVSVANGYSSANDSIVNAVSIKPSIESSASRFGESDTDLAIANTSEGKADRFSDEASSVVGVELVVESCATRSSDTAVSVESDVSAVLKRESIGHASDTIAIEPHFEDGNKDTFGSGTAQTVLTYTHLHVEVAGFSVSSTDVCTNPTVTGYKSSSDYPDLVSVDVVSDQYRYSSRIDSAEERSLSVDVEAYGAQSVQSEIDESTTVEALAVGARNSVGQADNQVVTDVTSEYAIARYGNPAQINILVHQDDIHKSKQSSIATHEAVSVEPSLDDGARSQAVDIDSKAEAELTVDAKTLRRGFAEDLHVNTITDIAVQLDRFGAPELDVDVVSHSPELFTDRHGDTDAYVGVALSADTLALFEGYASEIIGVDAEVVGYKSSVFASTEALSVVSELGVATKSSSDHLITDIEVDLASIQSQAYREGEAQPTSVEIDTDVSRFQESEGSVSVVNAIEAKVSSYSSRASTVSTAVGSISSVVSGFAAKFTSIALQVETLANTVLDAAARFGETKLDIDTQPVTNQYKAISYHIDESVIEIQPHEVTVYKGSTDSIQSTIPVALSSVYGNTYRIGEAELLIQVEPRVVGSDTIIASFNTKRLNTLASRRRSSGSVSVSLPADMESTSAFEHEVLSKPRSNSVSAERITQ